MKKNYILTLTVCFLFAFTCLGFAQSKDVLSESQDQIEGLSIFPNPVTNGKVFISAKSSFAKQIEIFDVLGKKIFNTRLYNRELDLTDIKAGVYIIKVKQGKATTTRKLVIR